MFFLIYSLNIIGADSSCKVMALGLGCELMSRHSVEKVDATILGGFGRETEEMGGEGYRRSNPAACKLPHLPLKVVATYRCL